MTTIAYDGKYFAVDSQFSEGATKYNGNKMMKYRGGYWSSCGEEVDEPAFQALLDGKVDRVKVHKSSACLFTKKGKSELYYLHPNGYVTVCPVPYAIGSGRELAIGAMAAGKNAMDAVKIAGQYSPYSGGPVKHVEVGK